MFTSQHNARTAGGNTALVEVVADPERYDGLRLIMTMHSGCNFDYSVQVGRAAVAELTNGFGIVLGAYRYSAVVDNPVVSAVDHYTGEECAVECRVGEGPLQNTLALWLVGTDVEVGLSPEAFEDLRVSLYAGFNYLENHNAWRMP